MQIRFLEIFRKRPLILSIVQKERLYFFQFINGSQDSILIFITSYWWTSFGTELQLIVSHLECLKLHLNLLKYSSNYKIGKHFYNFRSSLEWIRWFRDSIRWKYYLILSVQVQSAESTSSLYDSWYHQNVHAIVSNVFRVSLNLFHQLKDLSDNSYSCWLLKKISQASKLLQFIISHTLRPSKCWETQPLVIILDFKDSFLSRSCLLS